MTSTTTTTTVTTSPGSPSQFWFIHTCCDVTNDKTLALAMKNNNSVTGDAFKQTLGSKTALLWDNTSTVTYAFIKSSEDLVIQVQQSKVQIVLSEWHTYANINFLHIEDESDALTANIRISLDPNSGSWSYIGQESKKVPSGKPTMNLACLTYDTHINNEERGVILHQFGHALGLIHEYQCPANGGVTLSTDAVNSCYASLQNGWSTDDVNTQILNVYNKENVSNYLAADTSSIMKLFFPQEMSQSGSTAALNNSELSDMDKAYMLISYPFPGGTNLNNLNWNIDTALAKFNVASPYIDSIKQAFSQHDWTTVRSQFNEFLASAHANNPQNTVEDGDIVPTNPDWCANLDMGFEDPTNSASPTGASHAVADTFPNLWTPGETIRYRFGPAVDKFKTTASTPDRETAVRGVLDYYQRCANLTFVLVNYLDDAEITISFGNLEKGRSWSATGRKSDGYKRTENRVATGGGLPYTSTFFKDDEVPSVAPTTLKGRNEQNRTLFHEFGHALGLRHEHASPNVIAQNNDDNEGQVTDWTLATPFDSFSVMLYPNLKLFKSKADALRSANFFWSIGKTREINSPSDKDRATLGLAYPFPGPADLNNAKFLDNLKTLLNLDPANPKTVNLLNLKNNIFDPANSGNQRLVYQTYIEELKTEFAAYVTSLGDHTSYDINPNQPADDINQGTQSSGVSLTTGSFLDVIVDNLSSMFAPTTGQMFALQFPGRFLQQSLYAWDTSTAGIYGQFVKPTVVNESEFRLVDQLYNVGTVVGAPNGVNLSIVYEQCLNNLIPGFNNSAITLSKQQDQIRQWLLKDVPITGWVKDLIVAQQSGTDASSTSGPSTGALASVTPPQFSVANKLTDDKVNRMELAEALMQEYLSAKQAWELERDNMIKSATPETLDEVTRTLSHITAVREAQLASKYADAVVRGYSHIIWQYLSYLDIKSPAEALQDAKDALRESAASSLDGSMKVYPVQMQPIDWFQGLSTSFTLEDLTSDPSLIDQQISAKAKQLDVLNSRLAALQLSPNVNMDDLQRKLDSAQDAYDNAQSSMAGIYTNQVIALAKSCISAAGEFLFPEFKALAAANEIVETAYTGVDNAMNDLQLTQASRAYSSLLAQKSLAKATNTDKEKTQITLDINSLTKELDELTTRRQALRKPDATDPPVAPKSIGDVPDLPVAQSAGGSRWQEFIIHHTVSSKYSSESNSSDGKTSKTDIGLFLYNSHSESSSSTATSSNSSGESNYDVQIGFRATLVTVDRGGWFQPQFFKQSNSFYHIDENVSWSKWNGRTMDDLTNDLQDDVTKANLFAELNKYLLPAFPVGFIICKDITIKIAITSSDVQQDAAEMEKSLANSKGILCWSTSSAESSTSSEQSYNFTATDDGVIIRIPGPQILGYYLQYTDSDETTHLPTTLPDNFLVSDDDYDAALNAPKPTTSSSKA